MIFIRSEYMPFNHDIERQQALLALVKQAIEEDNALRASLKIGEKFRFIRDRLDALLSQVEESLSVHLENKAKKVKQIKENDVVVYVYLFNAHGLTLSAWKKMVKPELFYEYSVNRPIYLEKSAVEAFIRHKPNKLQHGYLSVMVHKEDILPETPEHMVKDTYGHVLAKVKEGALHFENLLFFTHADKEYTVNEDQELVRENNNNA
jgi:hypothetical protein